MGGLLRACRTSSSVCGAVARSTAGGSCSVSAPFSSEKVLARFAASPHYMRNAWQRDIGHTSIYLNVAVLAAQPRNRLLCCLMDNLAAHAERTVRAGNAHAYMRTGPEPLTRAVGACGEPMTVIPSTWVYPYPNNEEHPPPAEEMARSAVMWGEFKPHVKERRARHSGQQQGDRAAGGDVDRRRHRGRRRNRGDADEGKGDGNQHAVAEAAQWAEQRCSQPTVSHPRPVAGQRHGCLGLPACHFWARAPSRSW